MCYSGLQIIELGTTTIVELDVEITNFGDENAYKNTLKIIYPPEIDPNKVEILDVSQLYPND